MGLVVNRDLSKLSNKIVAAIFALIIVRLLDRLIFHSNGLKLILSFLGTIIFSIMTLLDSQSIKQTYQNNHYSNSMTGLAEVGAIQLVIDFLNLFLYMVKLFHRN